MFKKFYLYAIIFLFLFSAQNAWVMPFETAYGNLTDLMKEKYDIRVKDQLRLSHMSDEDVQGYAQNYFDAFHGVRYFLISGTKRDSTSRKKNIDQLERISTILFLHNWDIHHALMHDLLNVRLCADLNDKKIAKKSAQIAKLKALIKSVMHKHDVVDLDSVSGGAGAGRVVGAASTRTPRKKLRPDSSRRERVEHLLAPSSYDPLF